MNDKAGQSTILIVEDDMDSRFILSECLKMHGYRIREASNAYAAMGSVREEAPDLIFLDLSLPGPLSSREMMSQLKAHPNFNRIPVVLLSGSENVEEMRRSLGANVSLKKPVGFGEVIKAAADALAETSGS